ncbi:MAG: FtsW/RodA/SpoVE family cell cycle protein [Acutalibacteraceae bacterium]|nr:FtsW/RodA/SpoVE family cell cycle protein [Acutalibacteraceae bacterium]
MELITAIAPVLRYAMLGIVLFVIIRMLVALFCKKTTDPVRAKLMNSITGEGLNLYDREVSLGRNKKCDIVLPFETISRLHAVIAYRNKGFVIFDTFSKTGVTVNGEKINGKSHIYDGDVIGMGGLEYTLKEAKYKYIKDKSGVAGRASYGVILILLALFNIFSMVLNLFPNGEFKGEILLVYFGFIALQWIYFAFASFVMRINNFELEMIGFMFASVGLAIVGSMYPETVMKQFLAIVLGVVLYCALLMFMRFISAVKTLRWMVAFCAIGLLAVTLAIAEPTNGALSWLSLGGISIQPSELVKVAFIFAGAVTLEKLQSIRHLTMYIVFAAVCVGELFLMYDFGAALIFFFTFIVIAFMRSGDVRTLVLICMVAALGAGIILVFRPYVANRFSTYLHVWEYMDEGGFQQTRTLIYTASGGLFGLGLGKGQLRNIFAAAEDLVFGVVCEEFGMIMGFLIPLTYCIIAVWAVVNSGKAKSTFYSIVGVAASAMMLFQTMLNVFGITDLLPLTGVTLPFVSKGGSSVISCFCLLAFIKAIDTRTYASFKPDTRRPEKAPKGQKAPKSQKGGAGV